MINQESTFFAAGRLNLEATCDAALLRRLGTELARVYGSVLSEPVPPKLRNLLEEIDRAHDASGPARPATTQSAEPIGA